MRNARCSVVLEQVCSGAAPDGWALEHPDFGIPLTPSVKR